MSDVRILQGDCRQMLQMLPAESVHCVVTSPPYWGMRAYGTNPQFWGGVPDCSHEWETERYYREGGNSSSSSLAFSDPGPDNAQRLKDTRWRESTTCQRCGAWRGELGLEPTVSLYVEHFLEVFREVWRVLRKDGTLWINMGDCYATGAGKVGDHPGGGEQGERWKGYRGAHTAEQSGKAAPRIEAMGPMTQPNRMPQPGLKPKDLVGLPWRVAFALQEAGWWLRSDVIWAKPNPMPESVQDRPTRSHEYLFLLSKSERYFYDADAIREPSTYLTTKMPDGWDTGPGAHGAFHRNGREKGKRVSDKQRGHGKRHAGFNERWDLMTHAEQAATGRNKRDVWTIPVRGFPGAHFATFPETLVEPCILAGAPVGGTVLDIFAGSGTTLAVALKHARNAIGIELSEPYVSLIENRLRGVTLGMPLDTESA